MRSGTSSVNACGTGNATRPRRVRHARRERSSVPSPTSRRPCEKAGILRGAPTCARFGTTRQHVSDRGCFQCQLAAPLYHGKRSLRRRWLFPTAASGLSSGARRALEMHSSKGSREEEGEEDARTSCGERNGVDAIYDVKACTRPCMKSTAVEKWHPIQ